MISEVNPNYTSAKLHLAEQKISKKSLNFMTRSAHHLLVILTLLRLMKSLNIGSHFVTQLFMCVT